MNLSNSIFEKYFMNKISKEDLLYEIECGNPQFEETLKKELEIVISTKDKKRLEYLIYTLLLTEDNINIHSYVNILNELLISDWHEQHENIAMILQKIHSPKSVNYLKKAIYLKPQYLEWDENCAFEIKCIWALGYIKNQDAKEVLEKLLKEENKLLAENAKRQLEKMRSLK